MSSSTLADFPKKEFSTLCLGFGVPLVVVFVVWVILLHKMKWRPGVYSRTMISMRMGKPRSNHAVQFCIFLWWLFFLLPYAICVAFGVTIAIRIKPFYLGLDMGLFLMTAMLLLYVFMNYKAKGYVIGRGSVVSLIIALAFLYCIALTAGAFISPLSWMGLGYVMLWPTLVVFVIVVCRGRQKLVPAKCAVALDSETEMNRFIDAMSNKSFGEYLVGRPKIHFGWVIGLSVMSAAFNGGFIIIFWNKPEKWASVTTGIMSFAADMGLILAQFFSNFRDMIFALAFMAYLLKAIAVAFTADYFLVAHAFVYFFAGLYTFVNFFAGFLTLKKERSLGPRTSSNRSLVNKNVAEMVDELSPRKFRRSLTDSLFFFVCWALLSTLILLEAFMFKNMELPKIWFGYTQFQTTILAFAGSLAMGLCSAASLFMYHNNGRISVASIILTILGMALVLVLPLAWTPVETSEIVKMVLFPSFFFLFAVIDVIILFRSWRYRKRVPGNWCKNFWKCKLAKFDYAITIVGLLTLADFLVLIFLPFFKSEHKYVGMMVGFLIAALGGFVAFVVTFIPKKRILKMPLILLVISILTWFGFCGTIYTQTTFVFAIVLFLFVIAVLTIVFALLWIRRNGWIVRVPQLVMIDVVSALLIAASIFGAVKTDYDYVMCVIMFVFTCTFFGTTLYYCLQRGKWHFSKASWVVLAFMIAAALAIVIYMFIRVKSTFLIVSTVLAILFFMSLAGILGYLTLNSDADVIVFNNVFFPVRRLCDGKLEPMKVFTAMTITVFTAPYIWGILASVFLESAHYGVFACSAALLLMSVVVTFLIYRFDTQTFSALRFVPKDAIEYSINRALRIAHCSVGQPVAREVNEDMDNATLMAVKGRVEREQKNKSLFFSALKGQLFISAEVLFYNARDKIIDYCRSSQRYYGYMMNKSYWTTGRRIKALEIAKLMNDTNPATPEKQQTYQNFVRQQENERTKVFAEKMTTASNARSFSDFVNSLGNNKFRDSEFHPVKNIRERDQNLLHNVNWVRMEEWSHVPMIGPTKPEMMIQGLLGDCYFVTALSVIAPHQKLVEKLFEEPRNNQNGAVCVKFNYFGQWVPVTVDTYIPFKSEERPSMVRPTSRDVPWWPTMVEKAFAKYAGSYSAIDGGNAHIALYRMVGGWPISYMMNTMEMQEKIRNGSLWKMLLSLHREGHFICCGSLQGPHNMQTKKGIALGHAFAVLRVVEVAGNQLLQLRNTWGRNQWTGDWSDDSRKWTARMKRELQFNGNKDGNFWISFKDFTENFLAIYVNVMLDDRRWWTTGIDGEWNKGRNDGASPTSSSKDALSLPQWVIRMRKPTVIKGTLERMDCDFGVHLFMADNGGNRIKLIYRGDKYKEHAFIKNALVSSFEWTFDRDYDRPWTICLSRQPCNFDTRYRLVLRTNNPIELTPLS